MRHHARRLHAEVVNRIGPLDLRSPLRTSLPWLKLVHYGEAKPASEWATPEVHRSDGKNPMTSQRTLFEKIWDAHVVSEPTGRSPLIYIDLHLVHEVTSPQAFDGLRSAGRSVRQPS